MSIWILVANGSRAFLYQAKGIYSAELTLLHKYNHPESRKKGLDLVTDQPGKSFSSGGYGGNTYERVDPKEVASDVFAQQLSKVLKTGFASQTYEKLLIIAPPHFYGLIHKHLNVTGTIPITHIPKDYTQCTPAELVTHIKEQV